MLWEINKLNFLKVGDLAKVRVYQSPKGHRTFAIHQDRKTVYVLCKKDTF